MSQDYNSIFYYDYTEPDGADFQNFKYEISRDGTMTHDDRGLSIDTDHYTSHTNPGSNGLMDHIKFLSFIMDEYQNKKSNQEEFIYEACMSAKQIISPEIIPPVYRERIRNIYEDYRLCCSGLVVYDKNSMITAKILFTNDWIYGYYERRPGYKMGWKNNCCSELSNLGNYAGFSSIIPLCKRGASSPYHQEEVLDDFIVVGIGIDSNKGTIKFYVNRTEMFCISRIGYRLSDQYQVIDYGGVPYIANPTTLRLGFGHFSYLDHNIPNNYNRDYVNKSTDSNGYTIYRLSSGLAQLLPSDKYYEPYPDFTGEHISIDPKISFAYSGNDPAYFNFGQGMITRIKYITGYTLNTSTKLNSFLPKINPSNTHINDNDSEESQEYYTSNSIKTIKSKHRLKDKSKLSKSKIPKSKIQQSTENPIDNIGSYQKGSDTRQEGSDTHQEGSDISGETSDSIRGLLDISRNNVSLYKEIGVKSNTFLMKNPEIDSSVSSYSLGDLYKRSRKNKFMTKGDDKKK